MASGQIPALDVGGSRLPAAGALGQGRQLTGTMAMSLSGIMKSKQALNDLKSIIMKFNPGMDWSQADQMSVPGGPLNWFIAYQALPWSEQREFKAAMQRATTELRRELFGAAQTALE